MRGATSSSVQLINNAYFNPRSPCGERPSGCRNSCNTNDFNPRSPCGERRRHIYRGIRIPGFQSTLPMRGATTPRSLPAMTFVISIHAPHAGSDDRTSKNYSNRQNFNPRSPCGERLPAGFNIPPSQLFQSTLPMRGATISRVCLAVYTLISIHAPHAGSDSTPTLSLSIDRNFNPRSPCGERRSHIDNRRVP